MFCSKCGSPVNEGEKFCSVCGQKVENAEIQQPIAQPPVQQPPVQQTTVQTPYGQQPYGQQPYNNAYNNAPKKSKKGLVIAVSLIAVLAIAAVALFLWPGLLTSSAGTMQMKFISDNGQVFEDAFKGLGSQSDADMADKPFDMTMSMNVDVSGQSQKLDMDMAYDQETLGMNENLGITQIKMLLLGDVLYVNTAGQTTGIRFSSDADLSKPMPLKERMTAILNGLVKDLTGNNSAAKVDWEKLLVMMVNSIDKSNFKQSGSATTLTLDPDAIIATMKTFRDSLSKDKALLNDLESFIKGTSGQDTDVLKALDDVIKSAEDTKDSANFEITWTVNYEGGKPKSIDFIVNSAGQKDVEITFGYEDKANGKDISFAADTPGDSSDVTADFSYEKTGSKTDFTCTINAAGQTIKMTGTGTQNGSDMEGSMTVEAAGQTVNMTYDGTVKYGAPSTKVKDDSRFKLDTENVTVVNVKDLAGMLSSGMLSGLSTTPVTPVVPEASTSPETSSSISWIDLEGVWETQTASGGNALLFKDGSVYAGPSGASVDDILNDTAGVRGTKDGAFYMITGETLSIYNLDGSTVEFKWDGTNLWSSDGTEYMPRADATVNTY